jgi:hypothetical protein
MTDPFVLAFLAILLMRKNKNTTTNITISSPSQLVTRATQSRAMAWSPYFIDVGEIPAVADALSRWGGIESSGQPQTSRLNERGLLQVGPQTVSEGGMSQADWDALSDPDLLPNEQARISSQYWRWLYSRAATHLAQVTIDPIDQVWFAYQYHQRPKDFTQWGPLPGNAAQASAYLLARAHTNNDTQLAKRTTASNVVAWGTPDGPIPPIA